MARRHLWRPRGCAAQLSQEVDRLFDELIHGLGACEHFCNDASLDTANWTSTKSHSFRLRSRSPASERKTSPS